MTSTTIKAPDLAAPMAITEPALRALSRRLPDVMTAAVDRALSRPRAGDEVEVESVEPERTGATAVLSINGPILFGCDPWLASMLGCCTAEAIGEACDTLRADDTVAAVVLKIDSPGGSISGSADMLAKVRALAAAKPLYAIAADCACSMAYMLAALAREIAATPTAMVGSVAVIGSAIDASRAYEKDGLERVVYTSGSLKSHGVEGAPITNPQRIMMQRLVDSSAEYLVGLVAQARGVDAPVIASYEGAVFGTADARTRKLVDVVATSDEYIRTIAERHASPAPAVNPLAAKSRGRGGVNAMAETNELPKTPEELQAIAPELYNSIGASYARAAGLTEPEKPATPAALKAAFADDSAFALDAAVRGLTMSAAKAEYAETLRGRLAEANTKIKAIEAKAAEVRPGAGADPVTASATSGGANAGPADIMAAAKQIQTRDGCDFRTAMSRAHKEHPALSEKARTLGVSVK